MGITSVARIFLMTIAVMTLTGCAKYSLHQSNYQSDNMTAQRTNQAIPKYLNMRSNQWQITHIDQPIEIYQHHPAIPEIKRKLIILGDMKPSLFSDDDTFYDDHLYIAISQFQWRHGIEPYGIIEDRTIKALNITPYQKANMLMISRNKWDQYSDRDNAHYVIVNIPDFELKIMQSGHNTFSSKVITGTTYNQTPELDSVITTVVFNPTWNVPKSIIRNEIAVSMIEDENYLAENNIFIYNDKQSKTNPIPPETINWNDINQYGTMLRFTQIPGDHNVLGKVKFLFDNPYDVYLHDTQTKPLFNKSVRTFSHGCIRVEKPLLFAEYLLQQSNMHDIDVYEETLIKSDLHYVNLKQPIPVHVTYITSWVDEQGYVHFRDNVYRKSLY